MDKLQLIVNAMAFIVYLFMLHLKHNGLGSRFDVYCCDQVKFDLPIASNVTWTKWPPFRTRSYQMHVREWKALYFN